MQKCNADKSPVPARGCGVPLIYTQLPGSYLCTFIFKDEYTEKMCRVDYTRF